MVERLLLPDLRSSCLVTISDTRTIFRRSLQVDNQQYFFKVLLFLLLRQGIPGDAGLRGGDGSPVRLIHSCVFVDNKTLFVFNSDVFLVFQGQYRAPGIRGDPGDKGRPVSLILVSFLAFRANYKI